jgi:hypothetical protein
VLALAGGPNANANADEAAPVRESWKVGTTPLDGSKFGTRRAVAIATRESRAYFVGGIATNASGRERTTRDAAVLDLRTKRWRALPDVPFRRTLATGAIWAGDQLVVVGATCPGYVGAEHGCTGGRTVAAVYSADDRSWRRVSVPRFPRGFFGGPEPLYATRSAATFLVGSTFAVRLDLARDRWTRVRPNLDGSVDAACAARSFAAYTGGAPPSLRLLRGRDRSWSVPVTPAGAPLIGTMPACTAGNVVVTTGDLRAQACSIPCTEPRTLGSSITRVQRYEIETETWSEPPPPPRAAMQALPTGHGGVVDYLAGDRPGLRLDLETGMWSDIAPGPQYMSASTPPIWTGGLGILSAADRIFVYRPV